MSEKIYKLNLKDRAALFEILPREGNIVTLRIIRDLRSKLSFSEAEIAEYEITLTEIGNTGRFRTNWNAKGSKATKTVKISANAESVIVERLKELNNRAILPLELIDLYERFVEQKSS